MQVKFELSMFVQSLGRFQLQYIKTYVQTSRDSFPISCGLCIREIFCSFKKHILSFKSSSSFRRLLYLEKLLPVGSCTSSVLQVRRGNRDNLRIIIHIFS